MSILRLLNIPIVFLLDNSNLAFVREMIKQLSTNSFSGKIYVFSHYTNPDTKENLYKDFPSLIWKEAGETMIYEQVCADGNVLPTRVTFYLLPELIPEQQVVVLHSYLTSSQLNQINRQINVLEASRTVLAEGTAFSYLNLELLRQEKTFEKRLEQEYQG